MIQVLVLVLSPTGFIGGNAPNQPQLHLADLDAGSVLAALLAEFHDLHISALVRKASDYTPVHKLSPTIHLISGDKPDHDLIRSASAAADVVISAADNNDAELVRAIIDGLEQRAGRGASGKPVPVSTSGTGVPGEENDGSPLEGKAVDDSQTEDIKDVPADQPHRAVDLE